MKALTFVATVVCFSLGCTSHESTRPAEQSTLTESSVLTKALFEPTVSIKATRDESNSERSTNVVVKYGYDITPPEEARLHADNVWIVFHRDYLRAGVRRDAGKHAIGGLGVYRRDVSFDITEIRLQTEESEWLSDDTAGPLYVVVEYEVWSHNPQVGGPGSTKHFDASSQLLFVGAKMARVTDVDRL